ncbi:MAG: RNA polymerase sigma factor [bacterium]
MQNSAEIEINLDRLVLQMQQDSRDAFNDFYSKTFSRAWNFVRSILGDDEESNDILCEVYISAWEKRASYNADKGSPLTWLLTMCRSRALDQLRKRQRLFKLSAAVEQLSNSDFTVEEPSENLEAERSIRQIQQELSCLPEKQSTVVRMNFFLGMSHSEIALATGLPVGTVKSYIRRSLLTLKQRLELRT